jgi:hypothetical protein
MNKDPCYMRNDSTQTKILFVLNVYIKCMYNYDLLLYAVMFTVIVVLVYQFIKLIKKDPDFWLIARTNKEYMKHWDHLEKMHPKTNKSILNFKKETESNKKEQSLIKNINLNNYHFILQEFNILVE